MMMISFVMSQLRDVPAQRCLHPRGATPSNKRRGCKFIPTDRGELTNHGRGGYRRNVAGDGALPTCCSGSLLYV